MLFSVKFLESLAERFLEDVLMREAKPSWKDNHLRDALKYIVVRENVIAG